MNSLWVVQNVNQVHLKNSRETCRRSECKWHNNVLETIIDTNIIIQSIHAANASPTALYKRIKRNAQNQYQKSHYRLHQYLFSYQSCNGKESTHTDTQYRNPKNRDTHSTNPTNRKVIYIKQLNISNPDIHRLPRHRMKELSQSWGLGCSH